MFLLKIRPVIYKPEETFLSDKASKKGYWGFVRSRHDYEKEKNNILKELSSIIKDLEKEGYNIELMEVIESPPTLESFKFYDKLSEADLVIIFPFGFHHPYTEAILLTPKYVVFFDKFKPIYSGTLFAPPIVREYEDSGFHDILIVEGDWRRLRKVIRAVYALASIKKSKLVIVGPPNKMFGGMKTFRKAIKLFGFKPIFYTYEDFAKLFSQMWNDEDVLEEAKKIAEEFTKKAENVIETPEEKLLRASVYYLALKKLVEENEADWVTVNCLSELINKTGATPCMAFTLFNDSGIVATCEADPTMLPLHYILSKIAARPSVFIDPTVNEGKGTLILAHCTSPLKVLGYDKPAIKYNVMTHHESNTSATVKPVYPEGTITIAGFDFSLSRMIIIKGEVVGSPSLRICRAQVEVKVKDAHKVLENWEGFHWVYIYGDYVDELTILCKILGITAKIIA